MHGSAARTQSALAGHWQGTKGAGIQRTANLLILSLPGSRRQHSGRDHSRQTRPTGTAQTSRALHTNRPAPPRSPSRSSAKWLRPKLWVGAVCAHLSASGGGTQRGDFAPSVRAARPRHFAIWKASQAGPATGPGGYRAIPHAPPAWCCAVPAPPPPWAGKKCQ